MSGRRAGVRCVVRASRKILQAAAKKVRFNYFTGNSTGLLEAPLMVSTRG